MIQLKPGLQPATFVKNRKSLSGRPRSRRKKNRGLRFERVFSDSAVTPFDQFEWERRTAEITDDSGKVIFKQEEHRGAEDLERRSRRRSRFPNISTATSPTAPIRTKAAAKPRCGSWSIA